MGSIPDGTYEITGSVIRLLAGSHRTRAQLQSIAIAIDAARKSLEQPAKAIAQVKQAAPELSSIADVLPQTRNELYAFLSLILAALGVLIAAASLFKDDKPSEEKIQKMVNESIEKAYAKEAQERRDERTIRKGPKTGRNDQCTCGSGKKYKKCCLPRGANAA